MHAARSALEVAPFAIVRDCAFKIDGWPIAADNGSAVQVCSDAYNFHVNIHVEC